MFRALLAALVVAVAAIAEAQSPPPYTFMSPLLPLLVQAPENGWIKVNRNRFSDVWTPDDLIPLAVSRSPSRIILAWSGFAWDTNRGDLIMYGGGHANYAGNDVYRFHTSNLQWERASLPSEIYLDPVSGYHAIDGVDHAPSSAHTYDNNIFLPIADRFLTWGGAAYDNGGPYYRVSESNPTQVRDVGPYLFDPNRADGNKVGGTTGSHVQRVAPHPEIVGGNMWQNRDIPKNLAGQSMPVFHRQGCTAYAAENGYDVVYVGGMNAFSTQLELYRYQLTDIATPTLDQITKVGGYQNGVSADATCAYDPLRKLYVRTALTSIPFQFWDLTTPGPTNYEKTVQVDGTIAGLQSWLAAQSWSLEHCAIDFDPVRRTFPLWCGGGTVWNLNEPPAANTTSGWTVSQLPAPTTAVPSTGDQSIEVLGKWKYIQYFDVFVALEDPYNGNVWVYKPVGWSQPNPPGNALPTVSITAPAAGSNFVPGAPIDLMASASDSDGTIARVEYYVNGTKVGQSTSAPYTVSFNPIVVGSYNVVAVAVDNVGGMSASAAVAISVNTTLTTTVLQQGLAGYNGGSDTYLDGTAPTAPRGTANQLLLDLTKYTPLVRFAIFASEGGPLPNGAIVQSASLAMYKQYYNDTLSANALLKPWIDAQATWSQSTTGVPWSAPGAAGVDTDYVGAPDALVVPDFNPNWVTFDVTSRVRQWSSTGGNNGWRFAQTTPGYNFKQFDANEYAADPTLRPKLTIVYSVLSNQPPTVSIATPSDGAAITLGQSFTLTASAGDPDGSVASVAYFANGSPIGTATSAPYTLAWTPAATGPYALTAVATDNLGATSAPSAAVDVMVNGATTTTVVLQRGLSGYSGAADTYLDNFLRTTAHGGFDQLYLSQTNYFPLVRFAIFQPEGGPVPAGVTILSAHLDVYKGNYDDTLALNALMKPWVEAEATWNVSRAGIAWTAGGASAAGSDYNASADALVSAPYNAGWVSFDVTPRVQQWSIGGANYGWRMSQTTSGYNFKSFNASEYAADPTRRPKLTIVYSTSDQPPSVSLTSPAEGAVAVSGQSFTVTASASDSDGSVASVAFFANGSPIGTVTAAPYTLTWLPPAIGNYALTATATDDLGATATSAAVNVVVSTSVTNTVVLQRGLAGYNGAADTYLDATAPTAQRNTVDQMYLDASSFAPLVRFAVFGSEGGPIPNNAFVQSATLALYKQSYNDTLSANALLKPWFGTQATWTQSTTGVPWTVAGAAGANSDYVSTPDAVVVPNASPGWVTFDVTTRVRQWSGGGNNGWRLASSASPNVKQFDASEYAADTTLRPKLTIVYSLPDQPPTVSLTSPADGASISLGESFTVTASPADPDGTIASVAFFANGAPIGAVTAPYTIAWTPAATGSYALTAVATDNLGATTTSAIVNVTVTTTVVLQRGLAAYNGAADTYLDATAPATQRNRVDQLYLDAASYTPLVRFAVFASEGGPVPNGAFVQSATLALYKQAYNDTLSLNAVLKPWFGTQATWNESMAGAAWTVPGAAGANSDYVGTPDAVVVPGASPGWVTFDVTTRVALWSTAGGNNGWRLSSPGANTKQFNASEYAVDPTLRPMLTVTYR